MRKIMTFVGLVGFLSACSSEGGISQDSSRVQAGLSSDDSVKSDDDGDKAPAASNVISQGPTFIVRNLPVTTQGPFWPPSEVANKDGDFVLVGINLTEPTPGNIVFVPNAHSIISKNTVPPMTPDGKETPFNWFSKPYKVVRDLDLRRGSPDLDMVLWSQSYGPPKGNFGPAPRIPAEGDSKFNLNGELATCPDIFPDAAQAAHYKRKAFPLHQVPISGFQGDGIGYDAETGNVNDPATATGPGCPPTGCSGEDPISRRRTTPITLGEWLKGQGQVRIQLTNFDSVQHAFTAATIEFTVHHLLPESIYTAWAVRPRNAPLPFGSTSPTQFPRLVQPMAIPNAFRTDTNGDAHVIFTVENPFPDPASDTFGRRIAGVNIVFHSDAQNWGACFGRLGAAVDAHAHLSSFVDGTLDWSSLVTVPARH